MNNMRVPVRACLGSTWQPTSSARVLAPLTPAGRVSGRMLGSTAGQTRRLHHHSRTTPGRALTSRRIPQPLLTTAKLSQPLSNCPSHSYSTSTITITSLEPQIHPVFEPTTSTWQYLVADPSTQTAVVIDPVLDYNPCTRSITTTSADSLLSLIRSHGYTISHILETHAHADHLSASFYLQRKLAEVQGQDKKPLVGIGKRIGTVQSLFGKRYGVPCEEYEGVFDVLWEDDEVFEVGSLRGVVMHLPGHTPDHVGYRIGDNVFCGDSLFHPDLGTARCDFPGGSAHALYQSARKLLSLPDNVKIWTGHDYPVEGEREPEPWTSVGDHRARNKHIRDGVSEEEFVRVRSERDRNLGAPRLLHESLQVNIRAGQLPRVDEAGMRTFKLPVKVQGGW